MFLLNGDMNSPSADVSLLTILLVRAEHMAEQCFSKLASAGRDWPLHAVDFVYRWGERRKKRRKIGVNDLTAVVLPCRNIGLCIWYLFLAR